ncbi:uncharacterized protein LOC123867332 [Maniola jurtina]|uniref:uncharacterized protein LOC123867332 n=1 Tax=Maniola jurtina TaxID=191418 RepID=UPI001E6897F5|nr:uncharacterized protein LOC123867332 [Maniola jurtina]
MSTSSENSNHNSKHNLNKTSLYFYKVNTFWLIGALPDLLKWQESGYTKTIHKYIQKVLTVCIFIFVAMEVGSFFTQKNLSAKQASDMTILAFSHSILTSYSFVIEYYKEEVNILLYKLCIKMKNVYNDPEVERQMIKKTTMYSVAFLLNLMSALVSYGLEGVMQVLRGGTFVTVVTAWPDVTDKSIAAGIGRFFGYFMWWVCMTRVSAVFILIIITTGCLAYQFNNLQSYFYSLNDIFDEQSIRETGQENAEQKYEEALKVGIQLHSETLWCTRQCQLVCGFVYSAQIIINVFVFSLQMLQMMSTERTLAMAFTIVLTSASLLYSTGILMWNGGDVTVAAGLLPTAIYSSGWQNCRGKSSQRVRKLLVIAMDQAQRPVVLRSFGIMEISYQAYVSMVKASYSAFSLMY